MVDLGEKQFSLTRVASKTVGAAKKQFPINGVVQFDEISDMFAGSTGDLSGVSQSLRAQFLLWAEESGVRGHILIGVPGSGKSATCKALAGELGVPLTRVASKTVGAAKKQFPINLKTLKNELLPQNQNRLWRSCSLLEWRRWRQKKERRVVMKATRSFRSLIATFAVAIVALLAINFSGEQVSGAVVIPSPPPASLPMMGSENIFLNWVLTNQSYVELGISASWTDSEGNPGSYSPFTTPTRLTSFSQFQNWVVAQGMSILTNVLDKADVASTVNFGSGISYWYPVSNDSPTALLEGADIGYRSNITVASFQNLPITWMAAPMEVLEFQSFTIRVETNVAAFKNKSATSSYYCYSWVATNGGGTVISSKTPFTPPKEFTVRNVISLNPWYSTNGYPARFSIVSSNISRTYTQMGDPVLPSACKLSVGRGALTVSTPRGAVVQVLSSVDLTNWTPVAVTNMSIPITLVGTNMFFRAKATDISSGNAVGCKLSISTKALTVSTPSSAYVEIWSSQDFQSWTPMPFSQFTAPVKMSGPQKFFKVEVW